MENITLQDNAWLKPIDAASHVKLSTSTLAKMRMRGNGPQYVKAGPRLVLYSKASLDSWLSGNKRTNTSQIF